MGTERQIELVNDKALSKMEWESLHGTALFETLIRNRLRVKVPGLNDAKEAVRSAINTWLSETCNSVYYITGGDPIMVYIEGDADVTHFKLRFGVPLREIYNGPTHT